MAYRRRRRSGRRRRRRTRRSSGGYISMAYKAFRMARYLKGLINVEFKRSDLTNISTSITGTPSILFLTGLAEGDDVTQRNGRSVLLKSSYLQAQLVLGTATSAVVRIIIFMDKVSNGTTPTALDLLQYTSTITSPLNTDNAMNRFKVLTDRRYQLDSQKNPQQWVKTYLKQNHHLVYKGTTASSSDTVSGHLYMLLWSSTLPSNSSITMEYTNRIMFVDN